MGSQDELPISVGFERCRQADSLAGSGLSNSAAAAEGNSQSYWLLVVPIDCG